MKKIQRFVLIINFYLFCIPAFAQTFSWTQMAAFPGVARFDAAAFSIGSHGYFCSGANFALTTVYNDLWQYNTLTNSWTQKASLPGVARYGATAFAAGTKGYIATGRTLSGVRLKDLWQYNPGTNGWTQKANFGGTVRYGAYSAGIGTNAYLGLGDSSIHNDWWKYNQTNNAWTQKANFPGVARKDAAGFVINNKIYVGTGYNGTYKNDFWEYNPNSNTWAQKASFSGSARSGAIGFAFNGNGYVGTGRNGGGAFTDFKKYNPVTNSWTGISGLPASARFSGEGFSVGNYAYIGIGRNLTTTCYNDVWKYGPDGLGLSITKTNLSCFHDGSGFASVNATGGVSPYAYLWNNGHTTAGISNLSAGTYTVTVTDAHGTTETKTVTLSEPTVLSILVATPAPVCAGESVTLQAVASGGVPPYSYKWSNGGFTGAVYQLNPVVTTTYTVTVTDSKGCSKISHSVEVKVLATPSVTLTASGNGIACSPDSVLLSANTGTGLNYLWKRNNVTVVGALDSFYYAAQSGTYKVIVKNQYGCTKASANMPVTVKTVSAAITPSGTVSICPGATVNLVSNVSNGYQYQWRRNGTNISGANSSSYGATLAGTYKVQITDAATGCTSLSNGTVVVINCRKTGGFQNFSVYPNPSGSRFVLNCSEQTDEKITVNIYDISGRLIRNYVKPEHLQFFEFGTDLIPGIYFVSAGNDVIRLIKTER